MNLPTLITLSRIVLAVVFLVSALRGDWQRACWLFAAAAATDMLDGALARLLKQKTRLGSFLDPAADKLLMFFGFVSLTGQGWLPVWLTTLVILRDLMISGGVFYFLFRGTFFNVRPTLISKGTTFLQIATLGYALLAAGPGIRPAFGEWVRALAALFTVVSGCQYFRMGLRILKGSYAEKG